ncbi:MAG: RHS repeat-associated core domain-containing protein [Planctomycetes bacterium]|nr:RHS repeat-associated core domain-containing protein [Planctomycetota bacterium]
MESVTRLVDANGDVVEQSVYDPFGTPSVYGPNESYLGASSSVGLPFQWKGHRVDPETGLVYIRHRYYSREWGRFTSLDPLGIWFDEHTRGNAYTYGANAPGVYRDADGLQGQVNMTNDAEEAFLSVAAEFGKQVYNQNIKPVLKRLGKSIWSAIRLWWNDEPPCRLEFEWQHRFQLEWREFDEARWLNDRRREWPRSGWSDYDYDPYFPSVTAPGLPGRSFVNMRMDITDGWKLDIGWGDFDWGSGSLDTSAAHVMFEIEFGSPRGAGG